MKIVIVGAGRAGLEVATHLTRIGHAVTINIPQQGNPVKTLGTGATIFHEHASNPAFQVKPFTFFMMVGFCYQDIPVW